MASVLCRAFKKMHPGEKTLWNEKYSAGSHSSLEPEPLLAKAYSEFLVSSPPGRALDVAGGAGRHALWLAQRGWQVKLVDVSEAGVALARENAATILGLPLLGSPATGSAPRPPLLDTEVMDLRSAPSLGQQQYDLVLVFFYLQRELFPSLISALKPGGLLIYQTFTAEQRRFGGGPVNPDHLLRPQELRRAFKVLRILHYHETTQGRRTAELLAQKPHMDVG
jgi:tellurite methyltransferase